MFSTIRNLSNNLYIAPYPIIYPKMTYYNYYYSNNLYDRIICFKFNPTYCWVSFYNLNKDIFHIIFLLPSPSFLPL